MQNNQSIKNQIFVELATMPDNDERLTKIAGFIRGVEGVPETPKSCRLLTMGEASDRLNISRVTLWRMVRDGAIQFVEIGKGTKRIPESELSRFAQGKTNA